MQKRAYVIEEVISAKAIAARVETLAKEIEIAFRGTEQLVVVGLLRGSFVFIADLIAHSKKCEAVIGIKCA